MAVFYSTFFILATFFTFFFYISCNVFCIYDYDLLFFSVVSKVPLEVFDGIFYARFLK